MRSEDTENVSRRDFVALGSSAAFAIANAAAAEAQTATFGKPHPPIVAENDPAISVARPRLAPSAGGPIDAYAAAPRTLTASTPGVVVTMAVYGVDAQLRDVVRRYAKAGFIAIAPNLYGRVGAPSGDEATEFRGFGSYAQQIAQQGFIPTDLGAARDWVRTQASRAKVGLTGFCMGGGIAIRRLVGNDDFAAASIFYGQVRPPGTPRDVPANPAMFDYATRITTPTMGSYGALDTGIKPADVEATFARIAAPHDVKIYPDAAHAFFDDTRTEGPGARYVASAATDAWARTLRWFHTYLA